MAKKKKELEPLAASVGSQSESGKSTTPRVDVHNTMDKRVIALEMKVELLKKRIDRVVAAYNSSKKIRL